MKNFFTFLIILFSLVYLFKIDTDSNSKPDYVLKVKIKGLNGYNTEDLKLVESTLENFYKVDCFAFDCLILESYIFPFQLLLLTSS